MTLATSIPALRRLLPIFIFCVGGFSAVAEPVNVVVRVPVGTVSPAGLPGLLAKWRRSGQVTNSLLLIQGRADKPDRVAKFESLAVLEFQDEASYAAWERGPAAALPTGLQVRRADVLARGEPLPHDRKRAAFVVNTYTPIVASEKFVEFVDGYVKPLYAALQATRHLVFYTIYLERGAVGKVDALTVLEYRDAEAVVAVGKIKNAVRRQVAAATPSYARFDAIKDTLRIDGFGTFATKADDGPN